MKNIKRTTAIAAVGLVSALVPALTATSANAGEYLHLARGYSLYAGSYLANPTGGTTYTLAMQSDGNLVEYGPTLGGGGRFGACWSTRTQGHSGAYARYENSGSLMVLDPSGRPLWSSGTAGSAGSYVNVTDDGSIYVGVTRIVTGGALACNG